MTLAQLPSHKIKPGLRILLPRLNLIGSICEVDPVPEGIRVRFKIDGGKAWWCYVSDLEPILNTDGSLIYIPEVLINFP